MSRLERASRDGPPWLRPPLALRTAWPFVRPDRRLLGISAGAAVLLTLVEVSIPLTSRAYVDWITGDLHDYETWLPEWAAYGLIGVLLAAALARGALLSWQRGLAGGIGERTAARLRTELWAHLQRLPVDSTQRRGSGRLLVRFVSDIRSVQRLVTDVLIQGTQDLLIAVMVLAILVWLNWWMALPALLLLPAYAVMFAIANPQLREHSRVARQRRTRLSAFLNERIVGIKMVKAHGREQAEAARVRQMTRSVARRGARLAAAAARLQGASAAAVTIAMALTLALAPGEIEADRASGGTLLAFIMLLGLLAPMLRRLSQLNRTAQEAHVSLARLRETLNQRVEVGPTPALRRLRVRDGRVKVRNVRVVGEDGVAVLGGVSLEARRGELVALVGPNGSGKSTLLDVLLRFRAPTSGRVVVDGRLIQNVSLPSLRSQIGWVPQEAVLLDGTLLENITYGVRGTPDLETLDRAIRGAGLREVVKQLPDGLHTRVGSGDQVLSHGERQRVALARALLADPPILILDELSAAADARNGRTFARMLRSLATEKTVIVASHQPAILEVADRIYVLERGRVVEQGTHAELAKSGRTYRRLLGVRRAPPGRRRRRRPAVELPAVGIEVAGVPVEAAARG